jgi:hypothetical protein
MTDRQFPFPAFTLRLDPVTGDLRGLRWHDPVVDLLRDPRLGENFRILLPRPDREAAYFNSRDQTVSRIDVDATSITCTYESLRNDEEVVDVAVRYGIASRDGALELSIEVDNRTDRPLAEVFYGLLGGIHGIGPRTQTESLIPGAHANLAPNLFHTFPAGEYGGGNLGIRYSAGGFLYPGYGGLSMSWSEFYNRRSGTGLYYGLHDRETRLAGLYLELRPYTNSAVRGTNWPRRRGLPPDEPSGMTIGWLNFPYTRQSTVNLGPVVVRAHAGDWREGSAIYRRWFDRHFPIGPTSWLRDEMAWQSTILQNPEDVVVHRFADLGTMAAEARAYDVTTFEVCGWDLGGIDRGYPAYRPDPLLGTDDEFRSGLQAIRDAGVKPVVFANLQVADTGTDEYRASLHEYAVQGRWADDLHLLGFGEGTIGARLGLARSNMAIIGLGHPEIQDRLVDQMMELVRDGAAALQLDKTVVVQYLDFNRRSPLGPDRSLPEGLLTVLERIRDGGRAIDPELALASEIWWDRTFQYVDVLYSRMVDIDIPDPTLLYAFPEIASTIFAENPADFNVLSNGMRYGMVWAMAPRHYQDSLDERLTRPLARYLKELIRIRSRHREILFHGQFEDTRGATVGRHPDLRHSVFRERGTNAARQACVLVNFGDRPVETTVDWDAPHGRVEICQPFEADRFDRLPAAVRLPPQTCAVVVELASDEP